ncbi:hypothetical protein Bca52824_001606 [Brassica carinata]|uniref:Centromere protein S n=1 Tax=Brassica carinata TaxID=52824 RepID=A0A8X7WIV2_BRACI|nr:hypothetical protein Bca52824_001606 [Brassica carinata]
MKIVGPVVVCVLDLAFKYAENIAKDLELFAHHAGRKVVNMDDVVLSVFSARNDNLAASLRSLGNELKAKEPQSERKRKKVPAKKDDKASSSNAIHTTGL